MNWIYNNKKALEKSKKWKKSKGLFQYKPCKLSEMKFKLLAILNTL